MSYENYREAQNWFEDQRVSVSNEFDDRETDASRGLAVAVAIALVGKPGRVLDVGCGGGQLIEYLQAADPDAEVVGIDPAPSAIAAATKRLSSTPGVDLQLMSAEGLSSEVLGGDFGLAISHLNIGLWHDVVGGIAQVLKALRPGGLFYIVDLVADGASFSRLSSLALTEDETDYLRAQTASSMTSVQLREAIEEAAASVGISVHVHVGTGGLSGYPYHHAEATRLWQHLSVKDAVGAFSSDSSTGWKSDLLGYAEVWIPREE